MTGQPSRFASIAAGMFLSAAIIIVLSLVNLHIHDVVPLSPPTVQDPGRLAGAPHARQGRHHRAKQHRRARGAHGHSHATPVGHAPRGVVRSPRTVDHRRGHRRQPPRGSGPGATPPSQSPPHKPTVGDRVKDVTKQVGDRLPPPVGPTVTQTGQQAGDTIDKVLPPPPPGGARIPGLDG